MIFYKIIKGQIFLGTGCNFTNLHKIKFNNMENIIKTLNYLGVIKARR